MALLLKTIYEETAREYHLQLIAGKNGLDRLMSWIYISESVVSPDFLQGGELVITTGIAIDSEPNWLLHFIRCYIENHSCGLILNIGKRIHMEHITSEVLALCDQANFPLFIMPWDVMISNITKDYCNRIFMDRQNQDAISDAFQKLLHSENPVSGTDAALNLLNRYGYNSHHAYSTTILSFETPSNASKGNLMEMIIRHAWKGEPSLCHLCREGNTYLWILMGDAAIEKESLCTTLTHALDSYLAESDFSICLGPTVEQLSELSRSYSYAQKVFTSPIRKINQDYSRLCSFDQLGIFQLLLAVEDTVLLQKFARSRLQKLIDYDCAHAGDYYQTLYNYLLFDGSIKKMADAMFCHRNTINNRVKTIRESLGYPLDDSVTRTELMISYQILQLYENPTM